MSRGTASGSDLGFGAQRIVQGILAASGLRYCQIPTGGIVMLHTRRGYPSRHRQARDEGAEVNGYSEAKDEYLKRLRRIEGQVRGLQKMVEEDKYCIDILTQVSAATRALQSVAIGLLEDHMGHCVVDAAAAGGAVAELKVKEASEAIARLVRS